MLLLLWLVPNQKKKWKLSKHMRALALKGRVQRKGGRMTKDKDTGVKKGKRGMGFFSLLA